MENREKALSSALRATGANLPPHPAPSQPGAARVTRSRASVVYHVRGCIMPPAERRGHARYPACVRGLSSRQDGGPHHDL